MNDIVFCINDNWVMQATVLIKSILYFNRNSKFTFHILTTNVTDLSKKKIYESISEYSNFKIEFYYIDDSIFSKLPIRKNDHVTIETYFRFLIPSILNNSIKTALYLDCDILCTGNIDNLFKTDLTNYSVAMSPDTRYNDITQFNRLNYPENFGYYCAGVLLFNLDYWRKNRIADQCIEYLNTNGNICLWHDQDAINKVCHKTIKKLDIKYDLLIGFIIVYDYLNNNYTKYNENYLHISKTYWSEIVKAIENPIFIHFGGKLKPWHISNVKQPFSLLWREFYKTTFWKKNKLKKEPIKFTRKIKLLIYKIFRKKILILTYNYKSYEIEQNILKELYFKYNNYNSK